VRSSRTCGAFAALFEKVTGLEQARTQGLPGIDPWLKTDGVEALAIAHDYCKNLNLAIRQASDEDLAMARRGCQDFKKLIAFAELAQRLHGQNAFGFGALSESQFGLGSKYYVTLLANMLFLTMRHKALIDGLRLIAQTADQAMDNIQQARDKKAPPTEL
jgi:hypothetical protein